LSFKNFVDKDCGERVHENLGRERREKLNFRPQPKPKLSVNYQTGLSTYQKIIPKKEDLLETNKGKNLGDF